MRVFLKTKKHVVLSSLPEKKEYDYKCFFPPSKEVQLHADDEIDYDMTLGYFTNDLFIFFVFFLSFLRVTIILIED